MTTTLTYPVLTEEQFSSLNAETTQKAQFGQEGTRYPVSSVILTEEPLCKVPPEHTIRYVEVPIIEEVIRTVPVKSIVEIEKIVPKYEIEYIEKIVEVPQIQYIDRHVDKEEIQEVIREVPGEVEIQEIHKTVVQKVPKTQYVTIEKIVEMPGEVIDVTKKHVETLPPIKHYVDVEVPIIVAQTIKPVITTSDEYVDVDVFEYEPQVTPVDVYVATPIQSKLVAVGGEQDVHNCVSIPPAQYNTILKSLNAHIPDQQTEQLPFIKTNGIVDFLNTTEAPGYIPLDSLDHVNQPKQPDMMPAPTRMNTPGGHSRMNTPGGHSDHQSANERMYTGGSKAPAQMPLPKKPPQLKERRKRIFGC